MAREVIASAPSATPVVPRSSVQCRTEAELLRGIAARCGLAPDDAGYPALVNYYVALKTGPAIVLAGPAGYGKAALAGQVAEAIVGGDCIRHQVLVGHPWWATGPVGVMAHTNWNRTKLDALTEEAALPENKRRAFFACLRQISPAELDELAGSAARPFPLFPPNLFITATLDCSRPFPADDDLLASASVIWCATEWQGPKRDRAVGLPRPWTERVFLKAAVRGLPAVRRRLRQRLEGLTQPAYPLIQVSDLLHAAGVSLPPMLMDEAMCYLANSWSVEGEGLFHPHASRNLLRALDFVIAQTMLTRALPSLAARPALRDALGAYLAERFPHSAAYLKAI